MRKTWKQWQILSSWAPKSLQTVIETRKLKDMFLGEKLWQTILLFICLAGSTLYDSMDCSMSGFPVFHCLRVCSDSCPQSPWCHPNNLSSVVPFCSCPQSFPTSGSFPMSQLFSSSGQSIGASASATVLPMNTQDWSPLGWTGWISLQSKGLSKSLLQHHTSKASILRRSAFFTVQLSHPYMTTGKTIALSRWTFVGKLMSLLFNMLFKLVIAFLPRSKHLLISWLQSPSAVIWSPKK